MKPRLVHRALVSRHRGRCFIGVVNDHRFDDLMDATTLVVGVICLIVGIGLGRWSARPRTRVVWSESAKQWPPDAQIEALVRAGQKIYAIKRHRELHGTDLREAKDAIDALETRLLRNP